MKIDICLAQKEDAAVIADLSRQTFYETFASQNTKEDMEKFMNEQFSREALMEEVGAEGNVFLITYIGDEVAGYAKLKIGNPAPGLNGQNSLEIARIYAASKMIGKGIGNALMQRCIDMAKEMNRHLIWLGVWKENKRAIDFYKRWGFEIFGEQDFLLGNDLQKDWLMKKVV